MLGTPMYPACHPSITPFPGQGPPPFCAKWEIQRQGAMRQDHPGVPETADGEVGDQEAAFDEHRVWAMPAGWNRRGQLGSLGRLPRLRGWCSRPSKGAFLPAQDPGGKGGSPGRSLRLPDPSGRAPAVSGRGQHRAPGPSFPPALLPPPSPSARPFPQKVRGRARPAAWANI